jgi:hypothetical protein
MIECLHRACANAEDRIRAGRESGIENLPSAISRRTPSGSSSRRSPRTPVALFQSLSLEGELAICAPKAPGRLAAADRASQPAIGQQLAAASARV